DESQVVAGYGDGHIRRWRIEGVRQQGPAMQARHSINCVVVSQDGRWIVSADDGKKTIVWDAATHKKVFGFTKHGDYVFAVDVSSDCSRIASVDNDTAQIFSTASGNRIYRPLRHHGVVGVKFSPDGSRFATASRDHGYRVYSTHNGDLLFDSRLESSTSSWQVTPLVWSSDGQQLFVASIGKITCLNVSDFSFSEWSIHETQSRASIVSNGRFIACSAGPSVSLWDCVSHKQLGRIISHTAEISRIALSPSGGYLACGVGRDIMIHNLKNVLSPKYFEHCVSMHPVLQLKLLTTVMLRNALIHQQLRATQLPLIRVSGETLTSWSQGNPTDTEMLLSEEIKSTSGPSHHLLANRALIRARLKHLALAIEDVKEVSLLFLLLHVHVDLHLVEVSPGSTIAYWLYRDGSRATWPG
ncbi:hypothetical protein PISMIDRAFT_647178, partial [Pisolithus microcarpus 441]